MEMYYLWSCVPIYLFSFFNVVYAVQFCTLRIWEICHQVIEDIYSLFLMTDSDSPLLLIY